MGVLAETSVEHQISRRDLLIGIRNLGLGITGLSLVGCGPNDQKEIQLLNHFVSRNAGYEIDYPIGWQTSEGFESNYKPIDFFIGPSIDKYPTTVQITRDFLGKNEKLDNYAQERTKNAKTLVVVDSKMFGGRFKTLSTLTIDKQKPIINYVSSPNSTGGTVEMSSGIGVFFQEKNLAWFICLSYSGMLEFPDHQEELQNLYVNFYSMLKSFRSLNS